jgi:hypothetical protein
MPLGGATTTPAAKTDPTDTPIARSEPAPMGRAMAESISGRFEEAARKAQERISQRSSEKPKRTIAGDDVPET